MTQILVVSNDAVGLANTVSVLSDAGYHTSGASTFQEAMQLLSDRSPDLVIADERLGAFNGLHVILRARVEDPDVTAIVTTPVRDHALEADARSLNVECMVKPQNPAGWLEPIMRTLERTPAARCSSNRWEAIHAIA